jgi:hypothetical protein
VQASYYSTVGGPETRAKLKINQNAVKSAVETLRGKLVQQNYIIGKRKFLVDSQILSWTNQDCFRVELPLGNLDSKKLATPESSFIRLVASQLQKCADPKLRHIITVQVMHC